MAVQRWVIRGGALLVILVATALIGQSYAAAQSSNLEIREQANVPVTEREQVVGEREGTTVITTQQRQNSNRAPGQILAFGPDGRLQYYNKTYQSYWDVDPSPVGKSTVVYVASQRANDACPEIDCYRQVIERVNLSTGEVTRLYDHISPARGSSRWHDVDVINETHLLIGDIGGNRVLLINMQTGLIDWVWEANSAFSPNSGGTFPDDWTHLNDVEQLSDGRIMASLRNQDQVIFLEPGEGLQSEWTLGEDDNHDVLYEQHNPDFISQPNGGPAVIVANSEKNYVVEFQRSDAGWTETWRWQDSRIQWPRDADRLPNGHTLITDTHGGRVLEVNESGSIVWQAEVVAPYEAERLGTGDESTNGSSATAAGLDSQRIDSIESDGGGTSAIELARKFLFTVSNSIPSILVNGLLWVVPPWMGANDLILIVGSGIMSLGWFGLEFRWRYHVIFRRPIANLTVQSPVVLSKRDE